MVDNPIDSMVGASDFAEWPEGGSGALMAPAPNAESALAIAGQYAASGLEKPFANKILLIEGSYIAGTTHVEGLEEMLSGVQVGDRLDFRRDPENLFDEWAIKVILPGKGRVGFVPADTNQILARLMDGGKCVFGQVSGIEQLGHWTKVSMEVYLDD